MTVIDFVVVLIICLASWIPLAHCAVWLVRKLVGMAKM